MLEQEFICAVPDAFLLQKSKTTSLNCVQYHIDGQYPAKQNKNRTFFFLSCIRQVHENLFCDLLLSSAFVFTG